MTENLTNSTTEDGENPPTAYINFIILTAIVCILGIFANLAIICTIFSFKRLRTVPNMLLGNWAIADMYPMVIIFFISVLSIFGDFIYAPVTVLNVVVETEAVLCNTVLSFVVVSLIDWYLASYHYKLSERYRKHYKSIIIVLWVLTVLLIGVSVIVNLQGKSFYIPLVSFFFIYILVTVLLIIAHCIRCIQNCEEKISGYSTLTLVFATVLVLLWFTRWLNSFMEVDSYYFLNLLLIPNFFPSIIIVITMYCKDKEFRVCFVNLWRCTKCRS